MCYIHTVENYSTVKKKKLTIKKCRFKKIIVVAVNQIQRDKYYIISLNEDVSSEAFTTCATTHICMEVRYLIGDQGGGEGLLRKGN